MKVIFVNIIFKIIKLKIKWIVGILDKILNFSGDIGYYDVNIGKLVILKVYMSTLEILPLFYRRL